MGFSTGTYNHSLYMAAHHGVRPGRAILLTLALIVLLTSVCAADVSWAYGRTYPPIFGSDEKMFPDSGGFPKWTGMFQHLVRDEAVHVTPCRREQGLNICEVDKWKAFIEHERGQPISDLLDDVNRYMNSYRYVTDIVNYGIEDYWATPHEHVSNGGDCEDYAIAKYITLRKLGISNEDMRIVVVNDLNLKVQHAVLAVYVGSKIYILDNQTRRVQQAELIYHYQPIYSLTEGAWWMHVIAAQYRR
jgi:predicted transglutaminase-like cysteine proteinase